MYERLYRALYRIRRVEEEIARIYPTDKSRVPSISLSAKKPLQSASAKP